MGLLELSDLTFCFLASNSVTLLDLSNELIALALDNLPVIVGQATLLLLGFPDDLLPVSLHLVAVHSRSLHSVNPCLPTTSARLGFRRAAGTIIPIRSR